MKLLDTMGEKTFSVRAVAMLMVMLVLCFNACAYPMEWREQFKDVTLLILGFYFRDTTTKTTPTEGKPTP